MKKIIALLSISTFLASCTGSVEEKVNVIEAPTVEVEETTASGKIIIETEDSVNEETEATAIEVEETTIIENTTTTEETKTESENTDDAALESEVNDLLDEFIDSLDSYDK